MGVGLQNSYLDQDIQPLALTEADIDDLVAFLASLTSTEYTEQWIRELARQREFSPTKTAPAPLLDPHTRPLSQPKWQVYPKPCLAPAAHRIRHTPRSGLVINSETLAS
jgi:hypothetical protein